jgi:hypothetical protein
MGPAVVPGQDLAEAARPVGNGLITDLAARHRRWVTVTGKRRELDLLTYGATPAAPERSILGAQIKVTAA